MLQIYNLTGVCSFLFLFLVLVTDHQASAPKQASDAREAEAMNRSRCEKRKGRFLCGVLVL